MAQYAHHELTRSIDSEILKPEVCVVHGRNKPRRKCTPKDGVGLRCEAPPLDALDQFAIKKPTWSGAERVRPQIRKELAHADGFIPADDEGPDRELVRTAGVTPVQQSPSLRSGQFLEAEEAGDEIHLEPAA